MHVEVSLTSIRKEDFDMKHIQSLADYLLTERGSRGLCMAVTVGFVCLIIFSIVRNAILLASAAH